MDWRPQVRTTGLLWTMLLLLPREVAAGCPAEPVAIVETLERALNADGAGFEAARAQAAQELACASAPLDPDQVALLHRVEALAHYGERDLEAARRSLRAAATAAPGTRLPDALIPTAHLLRRLEEEAALVDDPVEPVELPRGMVSWVDGRVSTVRPTARSAVVQLVDLGGVVLWSALMFPGEALPRLPIVGEEAPVLVEAIPSETPAVHRPRRRTFLWSAGGLGLAAVALGGAGLLARASIPRTIDDPSFDPHSTEDLGRVEARRDLANGLGYGAQGAAAVAVGLGTVGLVLRW